MEDQEIPAPHPPVPFLFLHFIPLPQLRNPHPTPHHRNWLLPHQSILAELLPLPTGDLREQGRAPGSSGYPVRHDLVVPLVLGLILRWPERHAHGGPGYRRREHAASASGDSRG